MSDEEVEAIIDLVEPQRREEIDLIKAIVSRPPDPVRQTDIQAPLIDVTPPPRPTEERFPQLNDTQKAERIAEVMGQEIRRRADLVRNGDALAWRRRHPDIAGDRSLAETKLLMAEHQLFPQEFAEKMFGKRGGVRKFIRQVRLGIVDDTINFFHSLGARMSPLAVRRFLGPLADIPQVKDRIEQQVEATKKKAEAKRLRVQERVELEDLEVPVDLPLIGLTDVGLVGKEVPGGFFRFGLMMATTKAPVSAIAKISGRFGAALTRAGVSEKTVKQTQIIVDRALKEGTRVSQASAMLAAGEVLGEGGDAEQVIKAALHGAGTGALIGLGFGAGAGRLGRAFRETQLPKTPRNPRKRIGLSRKGVLTVEDVEVATVATAQKRISRGEPVSEVMKDVLAGRRLLEEVEKAREAGRLPARRAQEFPGVRAEKPPKKPRKAPPERAAEARRRRPPGKIREGGRPGETPAREVEAALTKAGVDEEVARAISLRDKRSRQEAVEQMAGVEGAELATRRAELGNLRRQRAARRRAQGEAKTKRAAREIGKEIRDLEERISQQATRLQRRTRRVTALRSIARNLERERTKFPEGGVRTPQQGAAIVASRLRNLPRGRSGTPERGRYLAAVRQEARELVRDNPHLRASQRQIANFARRVLDASRTKADTFSEAQFEAALAQLLSGARPPSARAVRARVRRVTRQHPAFEKPTITARKALKAVKRAEVKAARVAAREAEVRLGNVIREIKAAGRADKATQAGLRKQVVRLISALPEKTRGRKVFLNKLAQKNLSFRDVAKIAAKAHDILVAFNDAAARRILNRALIRLQKQRGVLGLLDRPGELKALKAALKEIGVDAERAGLLHVRDIRVLKQAIDAGLQGLPRESVERLAGLIRAITNARIARRRKQKAMNALRHEAIVEQFLRDPRTGPQPVSEFSEWLTSMGVPKARTGVLLAVSNSRTVASLTDGADAGSFNPKTMRIDTFGVFGASRQAARNVKQDSSKLSRRKMNQLRRAIEENGIEWGGDEMASMSQFIGTTGLGRWLGLIQAADFIQGRTGPRAGHTTRGGRVKVHRHVDADGKTVLLTSAERMQIYAQTFNPQSLSILVGKESVHKTMRPGRARDANRNFRLDENTLAQWVKQMPKKEKAIVRSMIASLNDPAWKTAIQNAVTQLFGRRLQMVPDYFPRMARQDLGLSPDLRVRLKATNEAHLTLADLVENLRLETDVGNRSFTRPRVGSKGMVFDDFFRVYNRHVNEAAAVIKEGPVLRDFHNFLNDSRVRDRLTSRPGGQQLLDHWTELLASLIRTRFVPKPDFLDMLALMTLRRGTIGVLGNNPWVATKQLGSMAHAAAEMRRLGMPPKHIAAGEKAASKIYLRGIEGVRKNIGKQLADVRTVDKVLEGSAEGREVAEFWPLGVDRYEGSTLGIVLPYTARGSSAFGRLSVYESSMAAVKFHDRVAIQGFIWNAYKSWLRELHPDASRAQILRGVAKATDWTVEKTQPEFNEFSMSGFALRSSQGGAGGAFRKLLIPFFSFRNKQANYIIEESIAARRATRLGDTKAAVDGISRMAAAVAINAALVGHGINESRRFVTRGLRRRAPGVKSVYSHGLDILEQVLGTFYFLEAPFAFLRDRFEDKRFLRPSAEGRTLPEDAIRNLIEGVVKLEDLIEITISDDEKIKEFQRGPKTGKPKAPEIRRRAIDNLLRAAVLVGAAPPVSSINQIIAGIRRRITATPPTKPFIQNQMFQHTSPGADKKVATEVVRTMLLQGVSAAQMRRALAAEAKERARARKHKSAAAKHRAIRNATRSRAYRERLARLNAAIARNKDLQD